MIYDKSFFAGRSETVALSASVVAPVVKDLLAPRSVLDIGCGQGEWLEAFALDDMFGVDIAAPEGEHFAGRDLRHPLDLGRTFDLVVCLEVGEHLPAESCGAVGGVMHPPRQHGSVQCRGSGAGGQGAHQLPAA